MTIVGITIVMQLPQGFLWRPRRMGNEVSKGCSDDKCGRNGACAWLGQWLGDPNTFHVRPSVSDGQEEAEKAPLVPEHSTTSLEQPLDDGLRELTVPAQGERRVLVEESSSYQSFKDQKLLRGAFTSHPIWSESSLLNHFRAHLSLDLNL